MDPVVIVGLARTPIGGFMGDLRAISAPNLGAAAVRSALERARLPGDAVDEVLIRGLVLVGRIDYVSNLKRRLSPKQADAGCEDEHHPRHERAARKPRAGDHHHRRAGCLRRQMIGDRTHDTGRHRDQQNHRQREKYQALQSTSLTGERWRGES